MRKYIVILALLISTLSYSQNGKPINEKGYRETCILTLSKIKERIEDLCLESSREFFNTDNQNIEKRIGIVKLIRKQMLVSIRNYNYFYKVNPVPLELLEKHSLRREYHLSDFTCIGE